MDTSFFQERLLVIAKHRYWNILFEKERLYYRKYIGKLNYHISYLNDSNVDAAITYVHKFEDRQANRVRNGFIIKPRKMLTLACKDTIDVLEGMQRWDGMGIENRPWFKWLKETTGRNS